MTIKEINGNKAFWTIYQAAAGNFCVMNDMEDGCYAGFDSVEEAEEFIRDEE